MTVAAGGLLCLLAALLIGSMWRESPTTDEPFHLTRGVAWFWGPDTSLSYAHPPFGNMLSALPIVALEPELAVGKLYGYRSGSVEVVADSLFLKNYDERRHWFFMARAVVAFLTVLMAGHVFWAASRLWGSSTGLFCLGFVCLHPTLIAHGRLVTTDMPVTIFMTSALLELALFLRGGSVLRLLVCVVLTGCAVSTKYTALALLPMFVVMMVGTAALGAGRYAGRSIFRRLLAASASALLLGIVAVTLINASYRFERTGATVAELLAAPEPQNPLTRPYRSRLLERETPLAKLPGWLPVPLPYSYVLGLASIKVHAKEGHPSWFFGKFTQKGSPWYFPVLLLIKTQVLLLGALLFGAVWSTRTRRMPSLPTVLLALYGTLLLLGALRTPINIGVRHVLPVMPIMAILAGRSLAHALGLFETRTSMKLAAGLSLLHLGGMVWCFPDYLSDFNALVLGRKYGQKISIVGEEWGQDMVRLGMALKRRGVKKLSYTGDGLTTWPELRRFGLAVERLPCTRTRRPPGYVAVKARDLARDPRRCFLWTRKARPLIDLNGHVFVYGPTQQKPKPSPTLTGAR